MLRDRIGRADFLSGSDRLVKDGIRAVEIAGEDVRDPLQEPGHRARDARRRELSCGLIGVRVHLLDTMAAQQSAQRSGEALDEMVAGPGHVLGAPAVDGISHSLGVGRPPGRPGQEARRTRRPAGGPRTRPGHGATGTTAAGW